MGNGASRQESHATRLLQRAMDGDLDEVKHMVEDHRKKSDSVADFVDAADPQGNNALIGAVFSGKMDVVKYLVEECGASMTCKNGIGCSPLWLAAAYNRSEVLEYLIQVLTKRDMISTEIMTTNSSGDTALLASSSKGNLECCKVLMQTAESLGLKDKLIETRNQSGDAPLLVSLSNGHDGEIVDLLMEPTTVEELDKPNDKGVVPILVACERDDVKTYRKLVAKGASLDVRDAAGSSPLAICAFCGSTNVMSEVLSDNKGLLEVTNNNNCSPLWLAARSGRHDVVKILLESGASKETRNIDGLTPLDAARKFDKAKTVELLEA